MLGSKERQIKRWSTLTQPNLKTLTCIICNNTDLYNNFKKLYADDVFCAGKLIRHQCPNCSLIFGDLRFLNLSEEQILNDHSDTYSYFTEGDNVKEVFECINSIDIFLNKNLTYLDYACGTGKFMSCLKNIGYNINGYDKYVKGDNILNDISSMTFEVIFSNNFIEHLINPIEQIKDMLNHLNYNGYLIFISDCIDEYNVEFTHFHTYYYVGNSFKLLCDKLNLTIVESKNIGPCKIKVLRKNSDI